MKKRENVGCKIFKQCFSHSAANRRYIKNEAKLCSTMFNMTFRRQKNIHFDVFVVRLWFIVYGCGLTAIGISSHLPMASVAVRYPLKIKWSNVKRRMKIPIILKRHRWHPSSQSYHAGCYTLAPHISITMRAARRRNGDAMNGKNGSF